MFTLPFILLQINRQSHESKLCFTKSWGKQSHLLPPAHISSYSRLACINVVSQNLICSQRDFKIAFQKNIAPLLKLKEYCWNVLSQTVKEILPNTEYEVIWAIYTRI